MPIDRERQTKMAFIGGRDWVVVSEQPIETVIDAGRPHLLEQLQAAGVQYWVTVRRPQGKMHYLAYKWSSGSYGWQS